MEEFRIEKVIAYKVWDGETPVTKLYRTETEANNKINQIKNRRKKRKREDNFAFKKRGANKNYPVIKELDSLGVPVELHQSSCYRIDEMGKTVFYLYPKSDKWFNVKEQRRGINLKKAVLEYFNY